MIGTGRRRGKPSLLLADSAAAGGGRGAAAAILAAQRSHIEPRAHALVAFPERSDARSPSPAPPPVGSNAPSRRRRATRTSGASAVFESRTRLVGALCHCSPCGVFLFLCRKPKTTIDRSTTRTGPRRSPTRPPPFPSTTPRDTKRPALWAMLPTPPRRLSP